MTWEFSLTKAIPSLHTFACPSGISIKHIWGDIRFRHLKFAMWLDMQTYQSKSELQSVDYQYKVCDFALKIIPLKENILRMNALR